MNAEERRESLLQDYVIAWEKLDGFSVNDNLDPLAGEFTVSHDIPTGVSRWRPAPQFTDSYALEHLYARLPVRFPPLFEQLLLSFRWPEVDLRVYRIHGNPLGQDLSGFLDRILKDKFLSTFLIKNGFLPFGKGGDMDYDPVCFNFNPKARKKNREYEIIKLDHEEILCNECIRIVSTLAPTFEQLVLDTITLASKAL